MFITNVLLKKAKSKHILVCMESMVSGHRFLTARERLGDKLEVVQFDPYIQQQSLYKEKEKVKSLSSHFQMKPKIAVYLGLDDETLMKNAQAYNERKKAEKKGKAAT